MPRTDPALSSESATRHLFRHFFDERELLRNPYVGSALAAGRLTMADLRARLAAAARSIEEEDRASGNHRRGIRQATVLVECTLRRRALAEVAAELGLSTRQLFRERHAAWARALRHLVGTEPAGPSEASFVEALCNHAARLFAIGRPEAGTTVLGHMLAEATDLERFMLAALGAELHHQARPASAIDFLAAARSSYFNPRVQASSLGRLTMMLLDELFETRPNRSRTIQLNADISDIALEPGIRWWMVRLAARLLIAKYRQAAASYDRRSAIRAAEAAIALGERVPNLPVSEQFNLRLLTARVDWTVRGVTPRAQTALVGNYSTSLANGWLSEVAQVGSLLASMMIVARDDGNEDYARTALAVANTLPEGRTARFIRLNLVVALLDAGRLEDAAKLLPDAAPPSARNASAADTDESQIEYAILARETAPRTASAAFPVDNRNVGALVTGDPIRAAYCSRVAAMELEQRDEHRAAVRRISEAWEITAHYGDWMSRRTIGRTYRELTRQAPPHSD